MMALTPPLILALLGGALYLAPAGKVSELGRLAFLVGLLALFCFRR